MQSPIIGASTEEKEPEYIKTGQRQKGDPMTSECFTDIKKLLAAGKPKTVIAKETNTSIASVRLISQSENFAEYRMLRSNKSNWRKPAAAAPKKKGLLARLLRR